MDTSIIIFLQSFTSETLIKIASFVTNFGDDIAMVFVLGLMYWCLDKKKGLRLTLYLGVVNIFYPIVKNIVKRPRPYMEHQEIRCLKPAYDGDPYDISIQSYAFPSGHMSNCGSVYGGLFRHYRNIIIRTVTAILTILIGISRIYLGVHYPSDVVVGLLFGIATIFLIDHLEDKVDKKKYYLALAVLGLAGFFICRSNDFYTGYGIMTGVMAGSLIEEKYINFKETRNILEIIVRVLGGAAIYLGLNAIMKMPFSKEFLDSGTTLSYLFRAFRYFVIITIDFGIYPACFRFIKFKK